MKNNGILDNKLISYYSDIDIKNYRNLLVEAIQEYEGENFSRVLDIGCGAGSFGEAIEPFGFEYYGLEGSKTGLDICSKKDFNCKRFVLRKDNKLPFVSNMFSLVLMNQIIEHLDKKTGQFFLKEALRVLEPGGVCIVKSPSYYSVIWRTDPHHVYCWKPNELYDEIKKSPGITIKRFHKNVLEPWMLFDYNEKIINNWHKYVKYKKIKKFSQFLMIITFKLFSFFSNSDRLIAVSSVTFVKKREVD
jgi:SAM-dependent methyltransferase